MIALSKACGVRNKFDGEEAYIIVKELRKLTMSRCLRLSAPQMRTQILSFLACTSTLFVRAGRTAMTPSEIAVNQPSVTPLACVLTLKANRPLP